MAENDFLHLKPGTVISNRFHKNIYFVIYGTDEMGTAYRGNKYRVYGAKQIDCDANFIRIDLNNYQFWEIEGKITNQ